MELDIPYYKTPDSVVFIIISCLFMTRKNFTPTSE